MYFQDEGPNTESRSKTFRRREIANNWAKYDIPPVDADDSTASARGQDFHRLLQAAGRTLTDSDTDSDTDSVTVCVTVCVTVGQ